MKFIVSYPPQQNNSAPEEEGPPVASTSSGVKAGQFISFHTTAGGS